MSYRVYGTAGIIILIFQLRQGLESLSCQPTQTSNDKSVTSIFLLHWAETTADSGYPRMGDRSDGLRGQWHDLAGQNKDQESEVRFTVNQGEDMDGKRR